MVHQLVISVRIIEGVGEREEAPKINFKKIDVVAILNLTHICFPRVSTRVTWTNCMLFDQLRQAC